MTAIDRIDLLDPALLRSFAAVAEAKSFTGAARRLGLQQSAVSQHIARLERRCARRLLARDTHGVALTPDGDALLPYAREVLAIGLRIERYLSAARLRGRVRFGVSEDVVSAALSGVLARFAERHEDVDLELTVARSGQLYHAFDSGDLDLIVSKRRGDDRRGRILWSERLRWVGRRNLIIDGEKAVPLVLYPPPSITRGIAIQALEAAGRTWRATCTSESLSGLHAAMMAGLGVTVHSHRLLPRGLAVLDEDFGLPPVGTTDFVLIGGSGAAATALAEAVTAGLGQLPDPETLSEPMPS